MPIATYLKENDYRPYDFKPYELPYESALKELGAKTAYWKQGVSEVQSTYSKLTGLNPSYKSNVNNLTSYTNGVNEQMKSIVNSNVSSFDNVSKMKELIKPLFDPNNKVGREILADHQISSHYSSEFNKINDYKTKDKGIYYSPVNEQAVHMGYNDFLNGEKEGHNASDYLNQTESYQPYYDYTKEISTARKDCPESSASGMSEYGPNGQYLKTSTRAGVSSAKMSMCIESSLSPKALSQLQLEGYVSYGKNYQALRDHTLNDLEENSKVLNSQITEAQLMLNDKDITPTQKEYINTHIKTLNSQLTSLTDSIKDYSGDNGINRIKENYKAYAGQSFVRRKLKELGAAYSYQDNKDELEMNANWAMKVKMQNDNMLKVLDLQQDAVQFGQLLDQKERFHNDDLGMNGYTKNEDGSISYDPANDHSGKTKTDAAGNIISTGNPVFTPRSTDPENPEASVKETYDYDKINEGTAETINTVNGTYAGLKQHIKNKGVNVSTSDEVKVYLDQERNKRAAKKPYDATALQICDDIRKGLDKQALLESFKAKIDNSVYNEIEQNSTPIDINIYNPLKPGFDHNQQYLTIKPSRILDMLKSGEIIEETVSSSSNGSSGGYGYGSIGQTHFRKQYKVRTKDGVLNILDPKAVEDILSTVVKKRTDLSKKYTVNINDNDISYRNNNPKDPVLTRLESMFGGVSAISGSKKLASGDIKLNTNTDNGTFTFSVAPGFSLKNIKGAKLVDESRNLYELPTTNFPEVALNSKNSDLIDLLQLRKKEFSTINAKGPISLYNFQFSNKELKYVPQMGNIPEYYLIYDNSNSNVEPLVVYTLADAVKTINKEN